ncbi:hypothetical protein [Silvanigrella aquatica]|uniref:Uncharacterized protein n=1 Tax=Silvanigrella aquatica TaxID=1915309 RepID=A0A1L4D387_9BACT|nr:hypothetical protein [Silvanigrella aquatica]APJ04668.1 hypothetical protein AXG55_12445 [Silvanigrella aquatica]
MNSSYEGFLKLSPNVQIDFFENEISITSPWVSLKLESTNENPDMPKEIMNLIKKNSWNSSIIQETLKLIKGESLSFSAPRKSLQIEYEMDIKIPSNPLDMIKFCCDIDDISYFEKILPEKFSWNEKIIKDEAKISSNCYDPITILELVRTFQLDHQCNSIANENFINKLKLLQGEDENKLAICIFLTISQTLYVTRNCEKSLTPALIHKKIKNIVEDFISSERGHDALIQASITSLKKEFELPCPDNVIFPETKVAMELLKLSAMKSPLAFAIQVNSFEGLTKESSDIFIDIMKSSKRLEKSSSGIEKHELINKNEDHGNIGNIIASKICGINEQEMLLAIRLAELNSIIGMSVLERISNSV